MHRVASCKLYRQSSKHTMPLCVYADILNKHDKCWKRRNILFSSHILSKHMHTFFSQRSMNASTERWLHCKVQDMPIQVPYVENKFHKRNKQAILWKTPQNSKTAEDSISIKEENNARPLKPNLSY